MSLGLESLKLTKAPHFRDAIDVAFVVGIPAPRISASKLLEWLRHRLRDRCIAVLTDIVKASAFAYASDRDFSKLRDECVISQ